MSGGPDSRAIPVTQRRNIICLSIDGLQAAFLGPYGNGWIETPAFNRLADEGFVFDRAQFDAPEWELLTRGFWEGSPGFSPSAFTTATAIDEHLAARLADRGLASTLVSDDESLLDHPSASRFADRQWIRRLEPTQLAAEASETEMNGFFAAASETVSELDEPGLIWIHTGSLNWAWDAPWHYRDRFAAEDDPAPPGLWLPPSVRLRDGEDPDVALGFAQAYAGQIVLLDECLGAFWQSCQDLAWAREALLVLIGGPGFPLGEHGRVGDVDQALFSERTRMALMLRFPDATGAAGRTQALVQPADVWSTLLDWSGIDTAPASPWRQSLLPLVRGEIDRVRDVAITRSSSGETAIATPGWYLRQPAASKSPLADDPSAAVSRWEEGADPLPCELFAKPDDFFEANEVATRCPDVVSELSRLVDFFDSSGLGAAGDMPPALSEMARLGMDPRS